VPLQTNSSNQSPRPSTTATSTPKSIIAIASPNLATAGKVDSDGWLEDSSSEPSPDVKPKTTDVATALPEVTGPKLPKTTHSPTRLRPHSPSSGSKSKVRYPEDLNDMSFDFTSDSLIAELNTLDEVIRRDLQVDPKQLEDSTVGEIKAPSISISTSLVNAGTKSTIMKGGLARCQKITLSIESTWGDSDYVGLTGLELLLGEGWISADLTASSITASPKDLSEIGFFGDHRVSENLVNGVNNTTNDANMWLIPFTPGGEHTISLDLGAPSSLAAIRIWNYNKSPDDVIRGARTILVSMDGQQVGRLEARMAPGCSGVVFGQTVPVSATTPLTKVPNYIPHTTNHFSEHKISNSNDSTSNTSTESYITPPLRQDYETPNLPVAQLWKLSLLSNHGDPYYIGLDGIEVIDSEGRVIDIAGGTSTTGGSVDAVPRSLYDIGNRSDCRIPSNLCTPNTSNVGSNSDRTSWLAPLTHSMTATERRECMRPIISNKIADSDRESDDNMLKEDFKAYKDNTLWIMFDVPTRLSLIRIFNYSKTPSRGAKEFKLDADGLLVCMGTLADANSETRHHPASGGHSQGQTICFSSDPSVVRACKDRLLPYSGRSEQDVLCVNERSVMVRSKAMQLPADPSAVGVVADINRRPATGVVNVNRN
jgi:hypothetical protein